MVIVVFSWCVAYYSVMKICYAAQQSSGVNVFGSDVFGDACSRFSSRIGGGGLGGVGLGSKGKRGRMVMMIKHGGRRRT